MRYFPHHFLVFIGLLFGFASALAGDDPFTIPYVSVSATGNNATQAREAAIASAEQQAFNQLLAHIAPAASSITIPPETLTGFVSGMEIHNEQITPGYYHAVINISFNPDMVSNYLAKAGIQTSASSEPANIPHKKLSKILIIPVLVNDQAPPAIIPEEPWYQTWEALSKDSDLFNYILADLSDLSPALTAYIASPPSAASVHPDGLMQEMETLKQRYHASLCVIATAYTTHTLGSSETVSYVIHSNDPSLTPRLFAGDTDTATGLEHHYHGIITSIENYLKKEWGQQAHVAPATMHIIIPIASLGEWIHIRDQLRSLDGIDTVMPERITTHQVTAQLTVSIPDSMLASRLEAISLKLTPVHDGFILSPFSGAKSPYAHSD